MKLAFACICKGADEEAPLLDTLLTSVTDYVDGIFVTITQPNAAVRAVAEKHNAHVSEFEWVGDFAAARNFNFAQVPKEYDYILWGDADDTFQSMDKLRPAMEQVQADAYLLWYIYDTDEYGMATVVHAKTMIVRNDDTFVWKGRIHEDIDCLREPTIYLIEDVKRIHHSTEDRVAQSAERNLGISMTEDEKDPRTWWNRSNAYMSLRKYDDAVEALQTFIEKSESESEKYLAYIRMGRMANADGDTAVAIQYAKKALAIKYNWPDAYFALGEFLMNQKKYYEAKDAILEGLSKKVPKYELIVYNPRDYDLNPLMLLAKCYWEMGRPADALVCITSCREIQPENETLLKMQDVAQEEADLLDAAKKARAKLASYKQKARAKKLLDSLTPELRGHPVIMQWANQTFIKKTSSGKDVVYFCGMGHETWNPESVKQGVGGSEEAVILLTREWAKQGYNVTVYTNCGEQKVYDGVTWKPWYLYNPKDKQDITILWRSLKTLDYPINSERVYIDLHDTIPEAEMTEVRLQRVTKLFVKSKAHRALYPKVPDEKFEIVNNPMDTTLFQEDVVRDPYLIVNTSSPERGLEASCRIFRKIKEREPRARMQWAYGWQGYDAWRGEKEHARRWKKAVREYMELVGMEELGRLSHEEVARLYKRAGVFLYPTRFYEIDCISARKAQIAGCHVVSSDYAALDETVIHGTKVHTEESKEADIDLSDGKENDDTYVDAVLSAFEDEERDYLDADRWRPDVIASKWIAVWES